MKLLEDEDKTEGKREKRGKDRNGRAKNGERRREI